MLNFITFVDGIKYKYYKEILIMNKYYSINEFSKILGVSAQTLRNWDNNGKLHPHHTSSNGYRYYSHEQLNQQELVKDLVQIITIFSCKLQGKRANKARKLVKELIEEGGEDNDKNNSSNVAPK